MTRKAPPSSEAVSTALGVLEARAQFDAPRHDIHIRVASHNGAVYIDLADKDWRAIEIDEDGWQIIDEPPVYFRRSSGMKALPEPVAGGSLDDDLRPLLNVKTDAMPTSYWQSLGFWQRYIPVGLIRCLACWRTGQRQEHAYQFPASFGRSQ